MKPWLGVLLGALTIGGLSVAAVAVDRRRRGLAGVREQVPPSMRKHIDDEIDDAEARARRAGAQGELTFIGAGQTGIVMCDERDHAFKVARKGAEQTVRDEASWMAAADKIPGVREHVARDTRFDRDANVLVRECVKPVKDRWRVNETKLFDLYKRIVATMRPYGYGRPEYKPDSFVYTRGRGPVLVDASFAPLHGRELVRDVLNVLNNRREPRKTEIQDMAFALRWERGDTVPADVANRLLHRLKERDPTVEL